MKKTIGIFAHIDAGKTTFCEQLFFETGALRKKGRVDHGDSLMDSQSIEKERGITVFLSEGRFSYHNNIYTVIDTPGHVDFSTEAERACDAIDAAILIVDGPSGVRPQTRALFRLLEKENKPCFFFINKTDLPTCDVQKTLAGIRSRLTADAVDFSDGDALFEEAAVRDEALMDRYLAGEATENERDDALSRAFLTRRIFPVLSGSALAGEGVSALLDALDRLTVTDYDENAPFRAEIFRVRVLDQVTAFLKVRSGRLHVRDAFSFDGNEEKISGIRRYQAERFESVSEAAAGDVVAVTGLSFARCGMVLENGTASLPERERAFLPAMTAQVRYGGQNIQTVLSALRTLEKEDPTLSVEPDPDSLAIHVSIMGELQLEILQRLLSDRFSLSVSFGAPKAAYRETLRSTVVGFGHYEPLRHYAEVQVALVPQARGSGLSFESRLHVDEVPLSFQNTIRSHFFSRVHRGVLTNSPLTDVKFVLLDAGVHEKHTEGGDLRQAAYRAVRQGLEKAEPILLEPFYRFEIRVPESLTGRILTDIPQMRGECAPPVYLADEVLLTGRAPAGELNGYGQTLAALSGGSADVGLFFDGYDICTRQEEVAEEIGYDRIHDTEHTSSSIFCQKGAGFTVSWREADEIAHTRRGRTDEEILKEKGL